MRSHKNVTSIGLLMIYLLFLASCTAVSSNQPSLRSPVKKGYTKEFDEPGTRGALTRISQKDTEIRWRFALSPDNKTIVYSGKKVGSKEPFQLYKIDVDGSAPVKLTTGGDLNAWEPCFSADGKEVIYRVRQGLWKINASRPGARMKISGSGMNSDFLPQISVDGKMVFVTWDTTKSIIWTCGAEGSELTQMREGLAPTWSPDGKTIAFGYSNDLWMMGADGSTLTQLTNTVDVEEDLPCFSPDGTRIAYVSNEGKDSKPSQDANIWTIKIDGTEKSQITELGSWDSWPQWGSDGIYFLSGRAMGKKPLTRIWRIRIQ
jgi:Tol biopolymer transport system component